MGVFIIAICLLLRSTFSLILIFYLSVIFITHFFPFSSVLCFIISLFFHPVIFSTHLFSSQVFYFLHPLHPLSFLDHFLPFPFLRPSFFLHSSSLVHSTSPSNTHSLPNRSSISYSSSHSFLSLSSLFLRSCPSCSPSIPLFPYHFHSLVPFPPQLVLSLSSLFYPCPSLLSFFSP